MEDKVKDFGFTAFGNFPLLFCKCSNKIYYIYKINIYFNGIIALLIQIKLDCEKK